MMEALASGTLLLHNDEEDWDRGANAGGVGLLPFTACHRFSTFPALSHAPPQPATRRVSPSATRGEKREAESVKGGIFFVFFKGEGTSAVVEMVMVSSSNLIIFYSNLVFFCVFFRCVPPSGCAADASLPLQQQSSSPS